MSWILIPLFFLSHIFAASIPVLGLSDQGESMEGLIEEKDYADTLVIMKEAIDQKVVGVSESNREKNWQLSKFSVGLGLTGEIGIGPYKYSSAIKQRFVYSR